MTPKFEFSSEKGYFIEYFLIELWVRAYLIIYFNQNKSDIDKIRKLQKK